MAVTNSKFQGSIIPFKTARKAAKEAKDSIDRGRSGVIDYLRTRWDKVNKAVSGGFRFGDLHLLAGLSGHGKSFFLTMLQNDFLDKDVNPDFESEVAIIHFGFEMLPEDEVLRHISSKTSKSYFELRSAETILDDVTYEKAVAELKKFANKKIFYADRPGNRQEIIETIYALHEMLPDHELVITLDHTLLTEFLDEASEVELISKLAKDMVKLNKDLKPLIIMLGQLNDYIEKPPRREPHLNFPVKGDIFGSKQIYHAMDSVMIIHSPEMLNLENYGPQEYPTEDLIALHFLKMRNGVPGLVRLRKDLSKGEITEWTEQYSIG